MRIRAEVDRAMEDVLEGLKVLGLSLKPMSP